MNEKKRLLGYFLHKASLTVPIKLPCIWGEGYPMLSRFGSKNVSTFIDFHFGHERTKQLYKMGLKKKTDKHEKYKKKTVLGYVRGP